MFDSEAKLLPNVCAALVKAQREFAPVLKDAVNPHFKSRYASLDGVIDAVRAALNRNGIALVQRCEGGYRDGAGGVHVSTCFVHESGEILNAGAIYVPAIKVDPQAYGSALTYARRYSLLAACGIAAEDDDGNAAAAPAHKRQGPSEQEREEAEAAAMAIVDALASCKDASALASIKRDIAALYKAAPWLDAAAKKLITDQGTATKKRIEG